MAMIRKALLLGSAAAVTALLDGGLATWPFGTAGWLALLGLWCVERGAIAAGSALLALAAALAPPAILALPLAALGARRARGWASTLRLGAMAVPVLLLGLGGRALIGWPPPTLATVAAAPLTAGAHGLWWLLLEGMGTHLTAGLRAARLPLYLWSGLAWLPCYALAALALWRGVVGLGQAVAFAALAFATIATGQAPSDGALPAVLAFGLALRRGWWLLLAGGVLATTLANLALAPLSAPPAPAPGAPIDGRVLNALARVALVVAWAAALLWPFWQQLPERWRRFFAVEPPSVQS